MLGTKSERKAKGEWPSRPGLSLALLALIWLAPAVTALAAGGLVVFALLLISAKGQIAFGLGTAAGLGFFYLAIRLTRPLQPVAALYRLSLSFPGAAPTRLAIARLALGSDQLLARMQGLALDTSLEDGSAAGRVLELAWRRACGSDPRFPDRSGCKRSAPSSPKSCDCRSRSKPS